MLTNKTQWREQMNTYTYRIHTHTVSFLVCCTVCIQCSKQETVQQTRNSAANKKQYSKQETIHHACMSKSIEQDFAYNILYTSAYIEYLTNECTHVHSGLHALSCTLTRASQDELETHNTTHPQTVVIPMCDSIPWEISEVCM